MALGLQGDTAVWPQNRWFGLFVPGKKITDFDLIADRMEVRPSVAGYFTRFDSDFDVSTLNRYGDRGLTPFLTLEPWVLGMKAFDFNPDFSLATLTGGSRDTDLRRIATAVRDYDRPIYLRLAHEMNGHWYPWSVRQNGNTAADCVAFWEHVRDLFSIAPKIRWVWACAAIQGLRADAPRIETLWPGEGVVDYAGTNGYGWDKDAKATYGRTFQRIASFTDHDFVIPEMGAQADVNRYGTTAADWTRSLGSYLSDTPRIRGFVWFHISQAIGATGDYRLDAPATIAALDQVLATTQIASDTAP